MVHSWPITDLWWKILPLGHALVMHCHTFDSAQNHILCYLYTQTSQPWDQDIGVLHALHSLMAQYVPERQRLKLATAHDQVSFSVKEYSETHSCLEYRPSSISASFPFLAMPYRDQNSSWCTIYRHEHTTDRLSTICDVKYLSIQIIRLGSQETFHSNDVWPVLWLYLGEHTLAGVCDCSVLTELEEEQWDPVFVSDPDTRRFLDSGELDI